MAADGTWNVNLKTPMGAQAITLEFTTDGNALSGAMKSPMGGSDFEGGTVDGDNLSWTVAMTTPMAMNIEFTATIDGDSISGNAKLGSFGDASFDGSRAS